MKSIILIEDDEKLSSNLVFFLQQIPYNVVAFGSVLNVPKYLNEYNVDLIVLDIKLPHVNGFQFLREIKKNTKWKEIPVIIISGLTDSDAIQKSIELGAVYYLLKPFQSQELANSIAFQLNKEKAISSNLEKQEENHQEQDQLSKEIVAKMRELLNLFNTVASELAKNDFPELGRIEDMRLLLNILGNTENNVSTLRESHKQRLKLINKLLEKK